MRKIAVLILLMLLIVSGCSGQKQTPPTEPEDVTETVILYYGDAGNDKLVTEEREITYTKGGDRYRATLEALISGPETEGYTDNIPSGTSVYGTMRQEKILLVNFTHHFNSFGGSVGEIVAVASVVNTLIEFDDIEEVKILVAGTELIGPSGEPRGFMTRFTTDEGLPAVADEVTLYFAKQDATALIPEERSITYSSDLDLAKRLRLVLGELIEGPQQENLARTIPREVRVLSIAVQDGIAVVDFSAELHTEHTGGSAGETMTIASIVNTLTDFDGVDLVAITVEGDPLNIENVVLDAPIERQDSLIDQPTE
ncbi:MAG: GerMN domain-containing protein [Firmicutes bacterium]|nr:GerMN domain-containing protein [Bacillota bacterium]